MFFAYAALVWLIPLLLLGGAAVLAVRFLRAYELRSGSGGELAQLRDRVRQLEERQDDLVRELAELDERQRFTTELLGEGARGGRRVLPGGRTQPSQDTPVAHDAGGADAEDENDAR